MFITFEGIEGCGKSTQLLRLADYLRSRGVEVFSTREPGGCPIADQIRAVLLDADNAQMVPSAELLLYAAARAQHVSEMIVPALTRGAIVLCDRFSDATRAYQSFGRGLPRTLIEQLNEIACGDTNPQLTVLIDCPVPVGLGRAKARIEASSGPREERFELEAFSFHERVRNGYLTLAAESPDRFVVIDGDADQDTVYQRLLEAVLPRLSGDLYR